MVMGQHDLLLRVLVVDDEPLALDITARLLKDVGFDVSTATSAKEALALIGKSDPAVHLVLTDVVMPETDGHTLGRLIGEKHPGLPVLYMSAYPANDIFHRGAPGPGLPFLAKPFTSTELRAAIQSLIARPANRF
jgi:CheY-like chemotaxis protein